jgi:hypothetical protein
MSSVAPTSILGVAIDPSAPPPVSPVEGAPTSIPSPGRDSGAPRRRSPALNPRLTAALALAVVAAVVIFLVTRGGSNSAGTASTATPATPPVTRSPAVAATATSLKALQTAVGHTVFWAGPANGRALAYQKASDGSVYVRYLPRGAPLSSPPQDGLSIVSYGRSDAYSLTQAGAKRAGAHSHPISGGGLAVSPPNLPNNVFFSRPGSPVLVEVYDPSPGGALRDVVSGRIRPLG